MQQGVDDDSLTFMEAAISPLPDDVEALKALVATMARKADDAEAKLANAMAHQSAIEALIAHLKLQIAKLKREQYGPSAERSRRLLDQMELQLEELEADAAEDDLIAEEAAAKTTTVTAFERKRPARKPFPEHLRCIPLGRKAWLFCGSDRGGQRAAVIYTLIQTAKLNDVDPQAWLADVLARIADHPATKLDELLPWTWRPRAAAIAA